MVLQLEVTVAELVNQISILRKTLPLNSLLNKLVFTHSGTPYFSKIHINNKKPKS
jgi:hypothetical protein